MLTKYNLLYSVVFILAGFQMFPSDWSFLYVWIGCVGCLAYYEQKQREGTNEPSETKN